MGRGISRRVVRWVRSTEKDDGLRLWISWARVATRHRRGGCISTNQSSADTNTAPSGLHVGQMHHARAWNELRKRRQMSREERGKYVNMWGPRFGFKVASYILKSSHSQHVRSFLPIHLLPVLMGFYYLKTLKLGTRLLRFWNQNGNFPKNEPYCDAARV